MKKSIVFIYNSFNDPLFQGNLLQHLLYECRHNRFKFHLITFEQDQYRLDDREMQSQKEYLMTRNIVWHPLNWHSGKLLLLKKIYDLVLSFILIARLKFKEKPTSIISLGTIAGGYAYCFKKLFNFKHYAYQFEPHSLFMLDFNIWKKSSMAFKILHALEEITAQSADIIATGTSHMMEVLKEKGITKNVYKLPSCVDDELFVIDDQAAKDIRKDLGISQNEMVIIYVGKFGGIYYNQEIVEVLTAINERIENIFVLILSPNNKKEIAQQLENKGIDRYFIGQTSYNQVFKYLNAADLGISAIPGLPSQKFRSPIKVGEYLLCGLPYICCKGVSEDDTIAIENQVGIVLNEFTSLEVIANLEKIEYFLHKGNKSHHRTVGLQYRGLSNFQPLINDVFIKLEKLD